EFQAQTAVAGALARRLVGAGESLTIAGQSLPGETLLESYAAAGYAPIWTNDRGLSAAGVVLIDQLRAAREAGMNMVEPLLAAIANGAGARSPAEVADLELLLSAGLIAAVDDAGDVRPPGGGTRAAASC